MLPLRARNAGALVVLAACVFLGGVGRGAAAAEAPQPTTLPTYDPIFQNDDAVRAVVARLGLPDRAEVVPLTIDDPYVRYELRAYYERANQMLVFLRADIDGEEISILRYQGPIPTRTVAALPVAVDADVLAAEAEARADAAERAAERAEEFARQMDRRFKRSLGKR